METLKDKNDFFLISVWISLFEGELKRQLFPFWFLGNLDGNSHVMGLKDIECGLLPDTSKTAEKSGEFFEEEIDFIRSRPRKLFRNRMEIVQVC